MARQFARRTNLLDGKTVDAGLLQSRYRLTKQRAAVLRALDDGAHLDAEAILTRVRADMAGVSLGTIYRTLDILREIGLVQMVTLPGAATRYEAALDKHHHLLCTRCRALRNVQVGGLGEIVNPIAAREGFVETDYALTITGLCADCSGSSSTVGAVSDALRGNSPKA